MSNRQEKPEWQTNRWWMELFGMFRDERIDEISRGASIWGYGALVLSSLAAGGFLLWESDWQGAIPLDDEFSRYRFNRQYLFHLGTLTTMGIGFFIWAVILDDDPRIIAWAGHYATPIFVSTAVAFARRAYAVRTVIMTIAIALISGVFGFLSSSGEIPRWIFISALVLVLVIACIITYRSFKKRPW